MEKGVLLGIGALRWALWLWVAVIAVANLDRRHQPLAALGAVAATGAVTLLAAILPRGQGWRRALSWRFVGLEVAVGAAAVLLDVVVGQGRRSGQGLSGNWPIAGILVAATAGGPWGGAGAGLALGAARCVGVALDPPPPGRGAREVLGAVSTMLVWVAVGAAMGRIIQVVKATRDELAEARAREAVARRLHDGVLQALALVERRTADPDLARIAREQDLALRAYLAGDHERPHDLAASLRVLAAQVERDAGTTVRLSLADELGPLDPEVVEAVVGAVGEALANAAKHGAAATAVVFADERDDGLGLEVSVKDDGAGFDPAATAEGFGLQRSVRARIAEVGGRVDVRSRPGHGAEVRVEVPWRAPARAVAP